MSWETGEKLSFPIFIHPFKKELSNRMFTIFVHCYVIPMKKCNKYTPALALGLFSSLS